MPETTLLPTMVLPVTTRSGNVALTEPVSVSVRLAAIDQRCCVVSVNPVAKAKSVVALWNSRPPAPSVMACPLTTVAGWIVGGRIILKIERPGMSWFEGFAVPPARITVSPGCGLGSVDAVAQFDLILQLELTLPVHVQSAPHAASVPRQKKNSNNVRGRTVESSE